VFPSLATRGKGRFFNNDALLMHSLVNATIDERIDTLEDVLRQFIINTNRFEEEMIEFKKEMGEFKNGMKARTCQDNCVYEANFALNICLSS